MKKYLIKYKWAIGIIIAIYIGSYFIISRISESEVNHIWKIEKQFLYVPGFAREIEKSPDGVFYQIHCCLYWGYYPISLIDHGLGGPRAMTNLPMFRLGNLKDNDAYRPNR